MAAVAAGIVLAFLFRPSVGVCVEFSGCREESTPQYAFIVGGVILAGVFVSIAAARRDRWKRDARHWNDRT